MIGLLNRCKKALSGQRGETLLEAVVSLFIFTILFTGITMMINASFRITGIGTRQINENQTSINNAILQGPGGVPGTLILAGGNGIYVDNIPVTIYNDNGFFAFAPVSTEPEEPTDAGG